MSKKQRSLNDFLKKAEQTLQITSLNTNLENNNLTVDVKFRLADAKTLYQLLNYKLYFDDKLLENKNIKIPFPFTKTEFTLPVYVLSLENLGSGTYKVRVEITEIWPRSGRYDFKEVQVTYTSEVKTETIEETPTIKSVQTTPAIEIVTEDVGNLLKEMEERFKKELKERREHW